MNPLDLLTGPLDRVTDTVGLVATMRRAGIITAMRPDKYVRIASAMARENMSITSGFAASAQRCPNRPGLVDELGTLTWQQVDQQADALAAARRRCRAVSRRCWASWLAITVVSCCR